MAVTTLVMVVYVRMNIANHGHDTPFRYEETCIGR